jgi:hypothetical protein
MCKQKLNKKLSCFFITKILRVFILFFSQKKTFAKFKYERILRIREIGKRHRLDIQYEYCVLVDFLPGIVSDW